jgi:hypothetical protein
VGTGLYTGERGVYYHRDFIARVREKGRRNEGNGERDEKER